MLQLFGDALGCPLGPALPPVSAAAAAVAAVVAAAPVVGEDVAAWSL